MARCQGYANACVCAACRARSAAVPRQLSPNKDVQKEIKTLRKLGFVYEGSNSSGHPCFHHEKYGEIVLPSTPSCSRWRKNHRADLARLLGLNSRELERKINGHSIRTGSPRESNGPGRPQTKLDCVIDHAQALGIPCDRATATKLLVRFGSVRTVRRTLDGMRAAHLNRAA